MQSILHLDFETYSEADIRRVGGYRYAEDPTTEALMLGYALDDEEVRVWDIFAGEQMPAVIRDSLADPEVLIGAYNAQFERLILHHCLGITIPYHRFRCTMVRAYGLSFTGSLNEVLKQFNAPESTRKDPQGERLIHKFSKPQPANRKVHRWTRDNDPEEWENFKRYCRQDVVVERWLGKKLLAYRFPESEWALYAYDQLINDRGLPVDSSLVRSAIVAAGEEKKVLLQELGRLTGLSNPNSNSQLLGWFRAQGVEIGDMTKETLRDLQSDDPLVRRAVTIRQQTGKTSNSKWNAFERATCRDGRVHGMFQFMGASRTARWAGRLVQLQNLPRPPREDDPTIIADAAMAGILSCCYDEPLMSLSGAIRCAITAPKGKLLAVSDLKSIEARVMAGVSGCSRLIRLFEKDGDPYKDFATEYYQIPYEQVTKAQRKFCKPPALGCQYMLGDNGLIAYAEGMGVVLILDESSRIVTTYRGMYPEVVRFWRWILDAVFLVTRTKGEVIGEHGLRVWGYGEFLFVTLPSGRALAYYRPRIEDRMTPWGEIRPAFTYMGVNRYTLKWERVSAHAGLLTENIVQAIARDILAWWMFQLRDEKIIGHVHDEIINECREDDAHAALARMNGVFAKPIKWWEPTGVQLGAAGYVTKRYKKD